MTAHDLSLRHLARGVFTHPVGVHVGTGCGGERGADDARILDGLRRAAERGMTLLDTSDAYGDGHAERLIGRALRERQDGTLQVSSTVGRVRGSAPHPYAGRHIHHQLQQTLDNLYLEQLALYTLESWDFGEGDRYLGVAVDQMRTLRDLEYIRAIGMRGPHIPCNASPAERTGRIERFLYLFEQIRPDVVWVPCNALTPALDLGGEDLLSFTAYRETGLVLAATTSCRGIDLGISRPSVLSSSREVPVGLHPLQERFGRSSMDLTLLALRYCLRRSRCIVVTDPVDAEAPSILASALTDEDAAFAETVYARLRPRIRQVGNAFLALGATCSLTQWPDATTSRRRSTRGSGSLSVLGSQALTPDDEEV